MKTDKRIVLKRVAQVVVSTLVAVGIVGLLVFVTQGRDMPVLNTHGTIANQQKELIILVFALGMLIVIPVLTLLFVIAWKSRATSAKAQAKYDPEFDGHLGLEALWWGIPFLFIIVLAIITGISTHALDPYKKLDSTVEPLNVQVVALEWKWLFIYPDKGVATLNYLNIPEDTPINFTLTSDAPMNSFWVPALAGQIYTMSGMSTKLSIMADTVGSYDGKSANISGDGFADMTFKVNSMTNTDFSKWLIDSANSKQTLDSASYAKLAAQSKNDGTVTYMLMDNDLYNKIIMKYMSHDTSGTKETTDPQTNTENMHDMETMNHSTHDMSGMDM